MTFDDPVSVSSLGPVTYSEARSTAVIVAHDSTCLIMLTGLTSLRQTHSLLARSRGFNSTSTNMVKV